MGTPRGSFASKWKILHRRFTDAKEKAAAGFGPDRDDAGGAAAPRALPAVRGRYLYNYNTEGESGGDAGRRHRPARQLLRREPAGAGRRHPRRSAGRAATGGRHVREPRRNGRRARAGRGAGWRDTNPVHHRQPRMPGQRGQTDQGCAAGAGRDGAGGRFGVPGRHPHRGHGRSAVPDPGGLAGAVGSLPGAGRYLHRADGPPSRPGGFLRHGL